MLTRTAVETASAVGDPRLHRHQLSSLAWCEGMEARLTTMSALLERGRALLPPGTDPIGDIRAAMMETDALVYNGSPLQVVEDSARPGFEAARAWAIDNEAHEILCAGLATARLRAGRTEDAEALIRVSSDQPPDPERWHHHRAASRRRRTPRSSGSGRGSHRLHRPRGHGRRRDRPGDDVHRRRRRVLARRPARDTAPPAS